MEAGEKRLSPGIGELSQSQYRPQHPAGQNPKSYPLLRKFGAFEREWRMLTDFKRLGGANLVDMAWKYVEESRSST
jgi:hypothetical protein